MNVLVVNCGSSSVKYQLLDMSTETVRAAGSIERVGAGYREAVDQVLAALGDLMPIDAVGHRIVHGGDRFSDATLVTPPMLAELETITPLAPLHHPAHLAGIAACQAALPGCPQVCVFDNGLHATLPPEAYTYALPHELARKHRIRRYGFHGLAFRSAFQRAESLLGIDAKTLRIVTLMLGSGNTANACDRGRSVEVSTGFTPHEGLVQSTRAGDMDAAIVPYLMEHEGLSAGEMTDLLNKKSGWLGISGVSADLRDVLTAAESGLEQAKLALSVHAHRARKYIGAYAAVMGGVDLLLLTGSVAERSAAVRARICPNLECMGLRFDAAASAALAGMGVVSTPDSPATIAVVHANEEIVIARDVVEVLSGG